MTISATIATSATNPTRLRQSRHVALALQMGVVSPARKQQPFRTCKQLAKIAGLTARTIERYCAQGEIPGALRTPTGHWRIPQASVDAFLRQLEPTG